MGDIFSEMIVKWGAGGIYRQTEDDRGWDMGVFNISRPKLKLFHVALILLSFCTEIAFGQGWKQIKA